MELWCEADTLEKRINLRGGVVSPVSFTIASTVGYLKVLSEKSKTKKL